MASANDVTTPVETGPAIGETVTETVGLSDSTAFSNGTTWSDIKSVVISDVDAYRMRNAFADLTARDKAIFEALLAAQNALDDPENDRVIKAWRIRPFHRWREY